MSTSVEKPADPEDLATAVRLLAPYRSFQLSRISSTTYFLDATKPGNREPWHGEMSQKAISAGNAYRVRISKDRYCFGETATAAVQEAVKQHEDREEERERKVREAVSDVAGTAVPTSDPQS